MLHAKGSSPVVNSNRGFTLIELLIVVAIIAILAAIAVPNFLEAQTRTKVSASMADIRTVVMAVETYSIDWNDYPYYPSSQMFPSSSFMGSDDPETERLLKGYTPVSITTPLAYLTSLPIDVFAYADADSLGFENPLQLYSYDQKNEINRQWVGHGLRAGTDFEYAMI
jgi:prepilin-type N-terminal cleavage/methylation domain-containing protein